MSARNIFWTVAIALIIIVVLIGLIAWKPFGNGLLVSQTPPPQSSAAASPTPSDVVVSHSSTASTVKEGSRFVTTIRYNGDTFSPRILVVSRGENVRFLNVSSLSMRIEADRTASTTVPATYQEAQSVGRNGAYELSFENPGVWVVYNLNDRISPTTAVVYVK